jgi:hypothetical protein
MSRWFREDLKGKSIPTRSIYIFDGEPRPDEPIQVLVLDQDSMAPLHTKLAWINDNLILQNVVENDSGIAEIAKDITWGKLAETIKEQQEEIQKDFNGTAAAAGKYMADTANAMTYILTNQIDKIVKDTFRMTEKIKHIDKSLVEWEQVLAQMEEMSNQIRRQKQETTHQVARTQNEFWKMEQQIQSQLIGSEKRRKELEKKVEDEIKKIKTTTQQIRSRLKSLKF